MVWENESDLISEQFSNRLKYFTIFVIVCFIILILNLVYIQVIKGNYYYRISELNTTKFYIEQSPRGIIYDCNKIILAKNRPVASVFLYPFRTPTDPKLSRKQIEKIEHLIPDIKKIPFWYNSKNIICLSENIKLNDMFKLLELRDSLPGIYVTMEYRRYYPYKELASHVLGYIGEIDKNELSLIAENGYKQGDIIGKMGIEKQYDLYLRGKEGGILVESDATGNELDNVKRIEPVAGNNIYLTIDIRLQKIAEDELKKTKCAGAVVGVDPTNGAIRILASNPGFDPNIFIKLPETDIEIDYRRKYLCDKDLPLYNRAIQGTYPPGSVFKIITALAALDGKKIDYKKEYYCPGYFQLGKKIFKCWEEKGHGSVSFITGIKKSCDVYFYNIGLETGIELISKYAKKFYLGSLTNIDLPSENKGFIPTSEWRKKRGIWYEGDTVNLSIGQGYIVLTPIQIARLISIVANKGTVWQPYLVSKIVNSKTGETIYEMKPKKIDEVDIPDEIWTLLEEGLFEVVNSGTGYAANIEGLKIAGKTGSAQNPLGEDHALFAAYAPMDNPQLALAIVVEHGGKGGAVAAPIAKSIFTEAFIHKLSENK